MFKVMIADDSPYVLQYLCNLIDWESFDFILTGSYTNAHGLLAAAKKNMPDAVITDITMPVMNGIELAAELYTLNPDLKIIFISSYSEFEYAKKALELHIFDYLLKPVQVPQLSQVMTKLLKQLKTHELQQHKKLLEESQKMMHLKAALTHYLSRLLFHASSEEKVFAEMRRLGVSLPDTYHIYVASITPYLPADSYIYSSLERNHPDIRIFPLITDTEYSTLLILYNRENEQLSIADFLAGFCIDVEIQLHTNITVGYSASASSFTQLPHLYEQAKETLLFLINTNSNVPLLSFTDVHSDNNVADMDPETIHYSQKVKIMLDFIHQHYMNDISTSDIAAQVYFSSKYANSFFTNECGRSISDYLTWYRIEKGKQLLTQTEETVTKIAELVGYGSKTAFYLAFKRHTNMSPTEYRSQYTEY